MKVLLVLVLWLSFLSASAAPREWQDARLVRSGNTHGGLTLMHYIIETDDLVIDVMGSRLKLTINKKTQIAFTTNRGKIYVICDDGSERKLLVKSVTAKESAAAK